MTECLWVLRDGVVVADIERTDGRLALRYRPEAVQTSAGSVLISASLPVRRDPYAEAALLPFFEGLLPEGLVRERIATRLRLDPADVFGLLREIGRDCAGALSIVPEGTDLAVAAEDIEWLDAAQLEERVGELAERPLAVEPSAGIRISLAGVQDKMVVVVDGQGRIGLPRGATASSHILKPASTQRRGVRGDRLAYPGLVANELFCTLLGRATGLRTVSAEVRRIAEQPALLIERYDRTRRDERRVRVHQEDFCQALAVRTRQKYEADGGPNVQRYLELLTRWSADVLSDQNELLDRVAFNYLIGNADAHAKNYALLHGQEGTRLAPAYDLVSTYVYEHVDRNMATAINGMHDARALEPIHWRKWFRQLGVSEELYSHRLADLAARAVAALPTAQAGLAKRRLAEALLDRVADLVRERCALLGRLAAERY